MSNRRRLLVLPHVAASFRAPRTRPAARAFLGRRAGRVDGARASGHSPWNGDARAGRPRCGGGETFSRRWVAAAGGPPPPGGRGPGSPGGGGPRRPGGGGARGGGPGRGGGATPP